MEEKKAAEYYDESKRKGENAAKYKQGLGFGTHSTSVPSSEAYDQLRNFVRAASPGRSAALSNEIRVENIRDKLKKLEDKSFRKSGSKQVSTDNDRKISADNSEGRDHKRKRTPNSALEGRCIGDKSHLHSRSSSLEKSKKSPTKQSLKKERRSRSRSRNRGYRGNRHRSPNSSFEKSKSPLSRKSTGKDKRSPSRSRNRIHRGRVSRSASPVECLGKKSSGKERQELSISRNWSNRGKRSRSPSYDSKGKSDKYARNQEPSWRCSSSHSEDSIGRSSDSTRKRRTDKRFSPIPDSRSKRRRRSYDGRGRRDRSRSTSCDSERRGRSRSRLYEGRRRDRSRSRLYEGRRRRRSRSSSYEDRRRDRSRSRSRRRETNYRPYSRRDEARSPYRSSYKGRSQSPSLRVSYSNHRDKHKNSENRHLAGSGRNEEGRRDERSPGDHRHAKVVDGTKNRSRRANEGPPERDYSKSISNFDSMTPAEKVKAITKLQLSETVAKDQAKGMSSEWERFDFVNSAPLDDDAKLDYFGDGTGAADDTVFLKNTGSTFLSSSNQVSRETQVAAMHEAAIFGPAEGLSLTSSQVDCYRSTKEMDHRNNLRIPHRKVDNHQEQNGACLPVESVVSEQVITMQQAGSWQERARKMKEDREAALANSQRR